MIAQFLEVTQYHPELSYYLVGCGLFIVLALFFPRRAMLRVFLMASLICSIFVLRICQFEQRWHSLTGQMFSVHRNGHREESLRIAKKLLEIARANFPADSVRTVESVHHVGWLLVNLARYQEAEPYFDESTPGYLKIASTLPNDHFLVCPHGPGNEKSLQGYVYQATNRPELAKQFYQEALEFYTSRCPGYPQYQKEMTDALASLQ